MKIRQLLVREIISAKGLKYCNFNGFLIEISSIFKEFIDHNFQNINLLLKWSRQNEEEVTYSSTDYQQFQPFLTTIVYRHQSHTHSPVKYLWGSFLQE